MDYDTAGSQTFSRLIGPISLATNNNASAGFDTNGYEGEIAVVVAQGAPTVGDAGQQFTIFLQASATNAASNATNCVGTHGVTIFTGTTNNAASTGVLTFDKRAEFRYLFVRTTITGGNSPAAPVAAIAVGKLQMQPN